VWGLPGSVTVGVVNYNKDLFDAANVPYPTAGWTTSEFLDKAVALTQGEDENKVYGYVPSSFGVNDLIVMLDRLGADMLDESVNPPAWCLPHRTRSTRSAGTPAWRPNTR